MEFPVKDNKIWKAIAEWKKWCKESGLVEEIKDRRYYQSKSRRRYLKRRAQRHHDSTTE